MKGDYFEVGDRIEIQYHGSWKPALVTRVYIEGDYYKVKYWESEFNVGEDFNIDWYDRDDSRYFKKVSNKFMKKLTGLAKIFLSKDEKTLYKAGFIDKSLELTEDGERAVEALIIMKFKEDLVAMAQEKLDEEKEDKE